MRRTTKFHRPVETITVTPDSITSSNLDWQCMLEAGAFTISPRTSKHDFGRILQFVCDAEDGSWTHFSPMSFIGSVPFQLIGSVADFRKWSKVHFIESFGCVDDDVWMQDAQPEHDLCLWQLGPMLALVNLTLNRMTVLTQTRIALASEDRTHAICMANYEWKPPKLQVLEQVETGVYAFAPSVTLDKALRFRIHPHVQLNEATPMPMFSCNGEVWVCRYTGLVPRFMWEGCVKGTSQEESFTYLPAADCAIPAALVTPWEDLEAAWLRFFLRGGLFRHPSNCYMPASVEATVRRLANWVVARVPVETEVVSHRDVVTEPSLMELNVPYHMILSRLVVDGVEVPTSYLGRDDVIRGVIWVQTAMHLEMQRLDSLVQAPCVRRIRMEAMSIRSRVQILDEPPNSPLLSRIVLRPGVEERMLYSLCLGARVQLVTSPTRQPVVVDGLPVCFGVDLYFLERPGLYHATTNDKTFIPSMCPLWLRVGPSVSFSHHKKNSIPVLGLESVSVQLKRQRRVKRRQQEGADAGDVAGAGDVPGAGAEEGTGAVPGDVSSAVPGDVPGEGAGADEVAEEEEVLEEEDGTGDVRYLDQVYVRIDK